MSRATQLARQQRRAFDVLRETVPGTVTIGSVDYDVPLVIGRGESIVSAGGTMATASLTCQIDICDLETAPRIGSMIEDNATSIRYEIVSVRPFAETWLIQAATFPGQP